MIYDLVISTLVPGKMTEWGEIASKELAPLRLKIGIKQVGSFHAYTGDMNKIYTLRVFDDLTAFEKTRIAQGTDKDWQRVQAKMFALQVSQTLTLLEPNPWSPMK